MPSVKHYPRKKLFGVALTKRQLQIAYLYVDFSAIQVAARLDLSVRTVETHIENIYRKLGIQSHAELVAWKEARPRED